jgi:hypothetical protein
MSTRLWAVDAGAESGELARATAPQHTSPSAVGRLLRLDSTMRPSGPHRALNEPSDIALQCQWCGSRNLIETEAKRPHFLQLNCGACRRWVRFKKTPAHVRRAQRFVLGFGICNGQRLGDLRTTARGRDYLWWLAKNFRSESGRMAAILVDLDRASGGKEAI